jgi:serine/threonine-protein kinase RsbW
MDDAFELKIKADISMISEVSSRLEEIMQAVGFSTEEILDTQLAVEEAITNVIVHGYEQTPGEIVVTCRMVPGEIEVQIADSAPPFDPLSIPEPDLDADVSERRVGGLGIYLLRQVMDGIAYRYENEKNILTLTKKIAG